MTSRLRLAGAGRLTMKVDDGARPQRRQL